MRKIFLTAISLFFGLVVFNACEQSTDPEMPPEIVISSPLNGAVVSGIVTIKTVVSSSVGIEKVEFYVNGDLIGSDSDAPYQYDWDTKDYEAGDYNLVCKAIDKDGNENLSEQITVKLSSSIFLLKVNVTDNWLDYRDNSYIFVSDSLGNLLADTIITGDGEYLLFSQNKDISGLKEISVSFTEDPYYHSVITTYMNIPVGSEWIFKGHTVPSGLYSVSLNFQNVPYYSSYVISTKWNNLYSEYLPGTYYFPESPTDIYLKLNTSSGVKYLWMENVTDGATLTNDLSNMSSTIEKNITGFDPNNIGIQLYLEGLYEDNYFARQLLDQDWIYENASSLNLHYPPDKFTNYATSFAETHDEGRLVYYYLTHRGELPQEFTRMDADFSFINESYANFTINASGDFIMVRTVWSTSAGEWRVYSNKNTTHYVLPYLPTAVENHYYITREEAFLQKTSIEKLTEIETYDDLINIRFVNGDYVYNHAKNYYNITKYYSGKSVEISDDLKKELAQERFSW